MGKLRNTFFERIMKKDFNRLKSGQYLGTLIKSALIALAVGSLFCGISLLVVKLCAFLIPVWSYVIIGLGGGLIAGAISFFILKPSDKQLAKKIDEDLNLGEKVQTMLAFENQSGAMIEMQRQDTVSRLSGAKLNIFDIKKWWIALLAVVIGLAVLIPGIIIPSRYVPPIVDDGDEDYEVTDWQVVALQELILDVQASNMYADAKTRVIDQLEDLIVSLESADKVSAMKSLVIDVIVDVKKIPADFNTVEKLVPVLSTSNLDTLKTLAAALSTYDAITIQSSLNSFKDTLGKTNNNLKQDLNSIKDEVDALLPTTGIEKTDNLYVYISNFAKNMKIAANSMSIDDADMTQERLREAFDLISTQLNEEIVGNNGQKHNKTVSETVVNRLMQIFGITKDDLPKDPNDNKVDTEYGDEKDDDKEVGEGGYGSGETVYGSDDIVLDPITGEHVKYSELINTYYAMVTEALTSGEVSEEVEQLINQYFSHLFNGGKAEE